MPETLAPSPDDTPFEHRVFQLTREDALAWLSRPRPISSLGAKLALVSILIPALLISVFENAMVARFPWLTGFVEIAVGAAALVTYFLAAWAIGAFEGWKRLRKAQAPSTLTAVSLFGDRLVVQKTARRRFIRSTNCMTRLAPTPIFLSRAGAMMTMSSLCRYGRLKIARTWRSSAIWFTTGSTRAITTSRYGLFEQFRGVS